MKKAEDIIHECFEKRGNDPSCIACTITKHQCDIMIPILINKTRGVNSRGKPVKDSLEGYTFEDKKAIIIETIDGMRKRVQTITKGKVPEESNRIFVGYLKKTFSNIRIQHFRDQEREGKVINCLKDLKKKISGKSVLEYTESEDQQSEDVDKYNDVKLKDRQKITNLEKLARSPYINPSIDEMINVLEAKLENVVLTSYDKELLTVLYEGREILINEERQNKTPAELAEIMGITLDAFKKRKSRLKKKVQEGLKNTDLKF